MTKSDKNVNLSPEQYYVLRGEGTEHPGSSLLNKEKKNRSLFLCRMWN